MKPAKFILLQTGIATVLLGIAWFLVTMKLPASDFRFVVAGVALTFSGSSLAYLVIYRGLKNNPRFFMNYLVGSIMLKMFSGLAAIFIVAWIWQDKAVIFATSFLFSYLIFAVPEVWILMIVARD